MNRKKYSIAERRIQIKSRHIRVLARVEFVMFTIAIRGAHALLAFIAGLASGISFCLLVIVPAVGKFPKYLARIVAQWGSPKFRQVLSFSVRNVIAIGAAFLCWLLILRIGGFVHSGEFQLGMWIGLVGTVLEELYRALQSSMSTPDARVWAASAVPAARPSPR